MCATFDEYYIHNSTTENEGLKQTNHRDDDGGDVTTVIGVRATPTSARRIPSETYYF